MSDQHKREQHTGREIQLVEIGDKGKPNVCRFLLTNEEAADLISDKATQDGKC